MTSDQPLDLDLHHRMPLVPAAPTATAIPRHVERFRTAYRAENIGPRYSGKRHLATTSAISLGLVGLTLSFVQAPSLAELAVVPLTFLFSNLTEYVGHRFPMHRPFRGLGLIYNRHSKQHHHFYTDEAMSYESWRDVEMVLFPALLIVFFSVGFVAPAGLLVYMLTTANAARLFMATVVSYFLLYEWLHFSY
ncbi:MAG: fatty acid hydroxylase family protein, partial [Byssovorax sp.]